MIYNRAITKLPSARTSLIEWAYILKGDSNMETKMKFLQVIRTSPALSMQTREFLIQHIDEIPEDVQQVITNSVAVLERRLIEALEETQKLAHA